MKFYLKLEFMLILIIKFNFTKLLLKNQTLILLYCFYSTKKINGLLIQMLNFCILYLISIRKQELI